MLRKRTQKLHVMWKMGVEDGNVKANMEATCTLKGVEGILRSTGRLYVN